MAKLWLEPNPEVAESYKLTAHELKELLGVAIEHRDELDEDISVSSLLLGIGDRSRKVA